jgi:hypothetical protein
VEVHPEFLRVRASDFERLIPKLWGRREDQAIVHPQPEAHPFEFRKLIRKLTEQRR